LTAQILDTLAKHFPPIINAKGYKELPPHLRIIQGDGVTHQTVGDILKAMKIAGFVYT
jgi:nicotinamide phosphoribosyltransferase